MCARCSGVPVHVRSVCIERERPAEENANRVRAAPSRESAVRRAECEDSVIERPCVWQVRDERGEFKPD